MKKALALALALCMIFALCACGSSSTSTTSTASTSTAASSDASAASTEASAETITFILAMVDNESSNYYKGACAIADCVKEATNGQIIIDVKAGGTLGGEADTLDMAIQGDLAIATCANSVLANYIPEMSVLDQAFLWDSADQANYAVQNELGDLIQAKANALGIHVIVYMESGFRDTFTKKPINSIEDFSGVKIRTMQNDGQLQAFSSFGANPIALAAGEQFTALQQGTIDACENAVSNCWVNKFYEAGITNVTNTHHSFVYIPLCMSDNAWNQIPDDLKDVFVEAVWEGCAMQWQYLVEANEEAIGLLEGVGVTVSDIDRQPLKEAYEAAKEAAGTTYDPEWVAAVEAAQAAVA